MVSVCEKLSKRQKAWREISQRYCMCRHCPIKSNRDFEQGPITKQMWFGSDITRALAHSHSQTGGRAEICETLSQRVSYTTTWCGALPCYCGCVITGPVSALTREKVLRLPRTRHVFDMFAVEFVGSSKKVCRAKSYLRLLSVPKIWLKSAASFFFGKTH